MMTFAKRRHGSAAGPQTLLHVQDLSISFGTNKVVSGLNFDLQPGETLALVGESGSGKSVTSLAIMGLLRFTAARIETGKIDFAMSSGSRVDLARLPEYRLRQIRGDEMAMVFQEPMTSLNPLFTVGDQISESLVQHKGLSHRAALLEAKNLLEMVRLPDAASMLRRYPHELSGGMRQRVMIAIALACKPRLVIADEPTTALDVTVQAQILATLRDLQSELGTAMIFVTHDMGVVAEMAHKVIVMRRGEKLETAPVSELFAHPKHPYTRMLLSAVPNLGSLSDQPLPQRRPVLSFENGQLQSSGTARAQDTVKSGANLLEASEICVRFNAHYNGLGRPTHRVHAVEGVSLNIAPGETLALVGESGSGKSTLGRTIQQLVGLNGGNLRFSGRDLSSMTPEERRTLKRDIHTIFQDPFASLNPRQSIGESIAEPIYIHKLSRSEKATKARVADLLERVGLPAHSAALYPHQFSGGQRQRICIARALASEPRLIIADEAVSAVDVSIQTQIVDLFMQLQAETGVSYLFISHDMAVVEQISHRVAVMYLGQIVEIGPRQDVFTNPQHPYTQRLLSSVPVPDPSVKKRTPMQRTTVPSPIHPISQPPERLTLIERRPGHWVADTTQRTNQ